MTTKKKRRSQAHLPSGIHSRDMKGLRVGPEWEEARVRAYDEDVSLSFAVAQLVEAYGLGLSGYDLPLAARIAPVDPGAPSRSVRVAPSVWEPARRRAVSEGVTASKAAALLVTAYARRELDLPETRLVVPGQ